MAIAISLTLASTMFLSVLLAYRIYHYNKGNLHFQLVFVAALFVTAISFLEYEISRQTFLDTVTFLGDVHIILCSFTVFVCIVSLWVIAPPLPKNKYPFISFV